MKEPFLDRHEFDSSTWKKLKAHLEERLAERRERNDGPLDPVKTATIRGEIAEIKRILNFELKAPE